MSWIRAIVASFLLLLVTFVAGLVGIPLLLGPSGAARVIVPSLLLVAIYAAAYFMVTSVVRVAQADVDATVRGGAAAHRRRPARAVGVGLALPAPAVMIGGWLGGFAGLAPPILGILAFAAAGLVAICVLAAWRGAAA